MNTEGGEKGIVRQRLGRGGQYLQRAPLAQMRSIHKGQGCDAPVGGLVQRGSCLRLALKIGNRSLRQEKTALLDRKRQPKKGCGHAVNRSQWQLGFERQVVVAKRI